LYKSIAGALAIAKLYQVGMLDTNFVSKLYQSRFIGIGGKSGLKFPKMPLIRNVYGYKW
jgi:hypothetical protein